MQNKIDWKKPLRTKLKHWPVTIISVVYNPEDQGESTKAFPLEGFVSTPEGERCSCYWSLQGEPCSMYEMMGHDFQIENYIPDIYTVRVYRGDTFICSGIPEQSALYKGGRADLSSFVASAFKDVTLTKALS